MQYSYESSVTNFTGMSTACNLCSRKVTAWYKGLYSVQRSEHGIVRVRSGLLQVAVKVGLLCAVPVCAGEMDALSIYVTLPPQC